MSLDMIIVCMPFAELPRPPLAPGLLSAILNRDGVSCRTLHANLRFGERIGIDDWGMVVKTHPSHFIPDYLFSHVAFPDRCVPVDVFIDQLEGRHWSLRDLKVRGYDTKLKTIQDKVTPFVDELADEILAQKPNVVGCSSTFVQQVPSLALLRVIKEKSPETITMLGGANCEMVMGQAIHEHCPWVDVVMSGEGDAALAPLVRQLKESGADIPAESVPGGVFVRQHREKGYPLEPGRLSYRDLDALPTPDYSEFFETLKRCPSIDGNFSLSAESSRGCWWGQQKGCTFCGLNGKGAGYAAKEPQRFLNELHELNETYDIAQFSLADNIIAKDYFTSLLPALEAEGAPYSLFYETKSNLRRKHVEAFRRAGVGWIQPGVESLSTGLLKHMRKGAEAWEHVQLLKLVLEYGIRIQWFILHDFPGEQDEWYAEMADLVPLITHLQNPVNMIPLQYCRFSEYYDNAEQYGLDLAPPPMARFAYPFEEGALSKMMYVFEPKEGRPSDQEVISLLAEMPSKRRLRGALGGWLSTFWTDRHVLEMHDDGEVLSIKDTRAVAVREVHRLMGSLRELYLDVCERCPSLSSLEASEADIRVLIEDKLAVKLDGRLVGLAVPPPRYEMLPREGYPGGSLNTQKQERSGLA